MTAKPKPPPCKCPRYAFPHQQTWQCVADELDRDERRDEAEAIGRERDRVNGTWGDCR